MDEVSKLAEVMTERSNLKLDQDRKKRAEAQNKTSVKARKSIAMKLYWENKREEEVQENKEEWSEENDPEANSFCTDSHYCGNCNESSLAATCPGCGEQID